MRSAVRVHAGAFDNALCRSNRQADHHDVFFAVRRQVFEPNACLFEQWRELSCADLWLRQELADGRELGRDRRQLLRARGTTLFTQPSEQAPANTAKAHRCWLQFTLCELLRQAEQVVHSGLLLR